MRKEAFTIVPTYLILGLLWIYLTDLLVNSIRLTEDEELWINLVKGSLFILLTSLLLLYLMGRYSSNLSKRDHQYEKLFEENPNPMLVYDKDTFTILAVNHAAVSTYGYSKQEFCSMSLEKIYSKEDQNSIERFKEKVTNLTDQNANTGIWQHQKKNGELFDVHLTAQTTIFDGKSAVLVSAFQVHEKLLKDQKTLQLKEQEAFLYSLLHSQSTFLIRIDLQGHYSFVNQAFCHKYSYEQKEIIGQSYKKYVVPEDHEKVQLALETFSSNTGRVVPIKIQRLSREGGKCITNWEFVAITNAKGEVKEFQGVGHDITQEKELEAEVERYEQNLTALINNTEDMIWSIDVDLRLISANQTFYKSIHKQTGRNIKKGDEVFLFAIEDEQREKWKQCYQRALQGEQYRFINHRVSKTGEESFIETSFNPIINKEKVIGVGCIARDITEIKKNENKLLQHNQLLREIAYMQSHKLRRPVATILSLVALFDKQNLSSDLHVLLLDKLEIVCQELDAVIHEIVGKTYELD